MIKEGESIEIKDLSIFGDPDWLHRDESQDNLSIKIETMGKKNNAIKEVLENNGLGNIDFKIIANQA